MLIKEDRHIHTPFCPHGSDDRLESYVQKAIELNYKKITFTEHAPLPKSFIDPTPQKDSSMNEEELELYFEAVEKIKLKYKDKITILTGLEVDYISGFEKEITENLDRWGPRLDDSILSVHFLNPVAGAYICMDYDEHAFQQLIHQYGSLEKVYEAYYTTVNMSIQSNLGVYKPTRIGHMTLVKKFQTLFPPTFDDSKWIMDILYSVQEKSYSLDMNSAGFTKPYCLESYPPIHWVKEGMKMQIPFHFGSDAHTANAVGRDREKMITMLS